MPVLGTHTYRYTRHARSTSDAPPQAKVGSSGPERRVGERERKVTREGVGLYDAS